MSGRKEMSPTRPAHPRRATQEEHHRDHHHDQAGRGLRGDRRRRIERLLEQRSTAPSTAATTAPPAARQRPQPARPRARRPSPARSPSTARAPSSRSPRPSPRSSRPPTPASRSRSGVRHRRRLHEVLRRRDGHQRRLAADQGRRRRRGPRLQGQRHRVRRAPGRDRRPDGRREPGERLRHVPDRRGARDDLRAGLAREPDVERRRRRASRPSRSSATCPAPTRARSTTSPRRSTARSTPRPRIATQSEDDNVLVTGVAGDTNAIGFFGYAYYVENEDKLKAVEVDGGDGLRRADRSDDQRQHVHAAHPAAVHLPEHRQGQGAPGAQRVRRLLPRQRRTRCASRGRLHRRAGRPRRAEMAEWEAAVGG